MARQMTTEIARSVGKLGGRPPGILNKSTIIAMKSKEAFAEAIKEKAGIIGEALLQNLVNNKDTSAGKELLERAFGKVPQGVQMQVATFSLKELAEYRKSLLQKPQDALPDALPGLPGGVEIDPEKKDV